VEIAILVMLARLDAKVRMHSFITLTGCGQWSGYSSCL
jgi:hypothetical protein